jgi:hypothetical protein
LHTCGSYFEKQINVRRKRTRGQNWSEDVRRTSGEIERKPTREQNQSEGVRKNRKRG